MSLQFSFIQTRRLIAVCDSFQLGFRIAAEDESLQRAKQLPLDLLVGHLRRQNGRRSEREHLMMKMRGKGGGIHQNRSAIMFLSCFPSVTVLYFTININFNFDRCTSVGTRQLTCGTVSLQYRTILSFNLGCSSPSPAPLPLA